MGGKRARVAGTLVSFAIALAAAGAFFAATSAGGYPAAAQYGGTINCCEGHPQFLLGGYPPAARYGGTAWVFLLALIVALPTVLPLFKRRSGG